MSAIRNMSFAPTGLLSLLLIAPLAWAADNSNCVAWDVSGSWAITQSNGITVRMDLQQTNDRLQGVAEYSYYSNSAQRNLTVGGPVGGYLDRGDSIDVTVYWSNSSAGQYTGQVDSSGSIVGLAVNKNDPNDHANFRAIGNPQCKTLGTPEVGPLVGSASTSGSASAASAAAATNQVTGSLQRAGADPDSLNQTQVRQPNELGPGQFQINAAGLGERNVYGSVAMAGWARFGREAAEQCSKRGFVGGHFNGHQSNGELRLLCSREGAVWRDAQATEIAATDWAFSDVNVVKWARANRAAERLCAQANQGFAGGHFNGHMLDGKFGLYCYAGPAQWFDATDAELAATGFGFATPRLDDVPWDQAMRAATNFCVTRGFSGGFMTGHQAPNRYGVVCQR